MTLNNPYTKWLIFFILSITWGSSFILMKLGLRSFSDLQVASIRLFLTFLVLSPVIVKNFKKIKKHQWKNLCIAGIIGSGIPAFLFTIAETKVSSAITGVLNSLVPLFTVILGLLFFKMKFRKMKALGALVGLVGAIGLLMVSGGISFDTKNIAYSYLVILATISYAANVNFLHRFLKEINSVNITAFGFLFIGPTAGVYLFTTDFLSIMQQDNMAWINLGYIAILAVFGTAIAVILFNMLIKRAAPIFASSVTYVIPVFAIMWGVLDGEQIHAIQFLFIALILTGVYIINRDRELEKT